MSALATVKPYLNNNKKDEVTNADRVYEEKVSLLGIYRQKL